MLAAGLQGLDAAKLMAAKISTVNSNGSLEMALIAQQLGGAVKLVDTPQVATKRDNSSRRSTTAPATRTAIIVCSGRAIFRMSTSGREVAPWLFGSRHVVLEQIVCKVPWRQPFLRARTPLLLTKLIHTISNVALHPSLTFTSVQFL
jgi:hypothetical protein